MTCMSPKHAAMHLRSSGLQHGSFIFPVSHLNVDGKLRLGKLLDSLQILHMELILLVTCAGESPVRILTCVLNPMKLVVGPSFVRTPSWQLLDPLVQNKPSRSAGARSTN